ncbi:hypothetical protein [Neobacillus vireti]|uniref:Uncharacterized protein n=1 Tax=Neobacillus vireti LMG 21834 TaxID=1131730 RepID=A0AB94IQS8_9BACI|nr:hypothetical protein [Neobacillus vireti]ETI69414.1 hypothetical protein BAVI_07536 [Neobacillus vireti LMG 21834]KLT18895.1 hypothetical protein AA980_06025 [Neobacillus vireti]
MEKKLKNIYKKQLFIDLVKLGHDFHHSMRNKNNPKYQVYVMVDTPKLRQDLVWLSGQTYIEGYYGEK